MDKITKFIGIDISKEVFDVWSDEMGHKQFKNSPEGFECWLAFMKDSENGINALATIQIMLANKLIPRILHIAFMCLHFFCHMILPCDCPHSLS